MSLTITSLGGAQSSTDGTAPPTAPSFATTAGVPVLFAMLNTKGSSPDTPTVTDDAGNTYTQVRTQGFHTSSTPTKRWTVFRMDPLTTATVTLTVSFGGATQTGFWWNAVQCAGAKTGANLVVQSVGGTTSGSGTATNFNGLFSLASFADATNNAVVAFIGYAANESATKESSATLLRSGNFSSPTCGGISQYQVGQNLAPTASWTSSVSAGGIAIEIADNGLTLAASGSELTAASGTPTYAGAFNAFRGLVLKWS